MTETAPAWWPDADRTRRVRSGGLDWQLLDLPGPQGSPDAPVALLLHGTGASTHSWRALAGPLAQHCRVLAPDLPGHAFTTTPPQQNLSLPAVSAAVAALLRTLGVAPALLVGHSAGAAVALRLVLDGHCHPDLTVSINGALLPLQGPWGRLFLPLARLLSLNPLVPSVFAAWAGSAAATRRLLDSTGSQVDALGQRCYAHLMGSRSHAAGVLRLMASWDLASLASELAQLQAPVLLLQGSRDRMVPPEHARAVAALLPGARSVTLPGLGHLAHEEDADAVLAALLDAWHPHLRRRAA